MLVPLDLMFRLCFHLIFKPFRKPYLSLGLEKTVPLYPRDFSIFFPTWLPGGPQQWSLGVKVLQVLKIFLPLVADPQGKSRSLKFLLLVGVWSRDFSQGKHFPFRSKLDALAAPCRPGLRKWANTRGGYEARNNSERSANKKGQGWASECEKATLFKIYQLF